MNFWHWGVNFNNDGESHYTFMLNKGIIMALRRRSHTKSEIFSCS